MLLPAVPWIIKLMARTQKGLTYGGIGVDTAIEAKAARILYEASKQTWKNRLGTLGEVLVPFDDFSGLRYIKVDSLPKGTVMYGNSDGIATKAELAEKANRYDTLAYDLMAMVCDDAVVRGGEPALLKSVLDVNSLGQDDSRLSYIQQLANGYIGAAKEAGVAVINGEIAQLNDRVGREHFSLDWSADVTWFAHESRLITGMKIKTGDYIVGFREEGLRCNGISLVRRLLQAKYGEQWQEAKLGNDRIIDLALKPSRIYSKAVVDMFGGYDLGRPSRAKLHGAAHISGGGIPEKLGRALKPTGLGAVISDPFEPCNLMAYCQELGNIDDREAYKTWNMGQGMLLISDSYEDILKVAADHEIEAKVVGKITRKSGITINSKGLTGGTLSM